MNPSISLSLLEDAFFDVEQQKRNSLSCYPAVPEIYDKNILLWYIHVEVPCCLFSALRKCSLKQEDGSKV
jgi:hypothetical protein